MLRVLTVVLGVVLVLAVHEQRADAIAACGNGEGWALPSGATVPAHPRLVYYIDGRDPQSAHPPTIKATIDGKGVTAKVTFLGATPYELAIVEVDSDRTGALELRWVAPAGSYWQAAEPKATFKVVKVKLPTEAKGKAARFHQAYRHSTVHELEDGLAIAVDVAATRFTARWRTDSTKSWTTLELTAVTRDGRQVARLGALGCNGNFAVGVLEKGIDLELTAVLADGTGVPVKGVPAHVVLAPLPKDAATSSP